MHFDLDEVWMWYCWGGGGGELRPESFATGGNERNHVLVPSLRKTGQGAKRLEAQERQMFNDDISIVLLLLGYHFNGIRIKNKIWPSSEPSLMLKSCLFKSWFLHILVTVTIDNSHILIYKYIFSWERAIIVRMIWTCSIFNRFMNETIFRQDHTLLSH